VSQITWTDEPCFGCGVDMPTRYCVKQDDAGAAYTERTAMICQDCREYAYEQQAHKLDPTYDLEAPHNWTSICKILRKLYFFPLLEDVPE